MAESLPPDAAGWILVSSRGDDQYSQIVRCPDHPPGAIPGDGESWESLLAADCPPEAACEKCDEPLR